MGRDSQVASNSHADRGMLKGGTRRLHAHPLRALEPQPRTEGDPMATSRVGRPTVRRYQWGRDERRPRRSRLATGLHSVVAAGVPIAVIAGVALLRTGGVEAAAVRVTGPRVEVPEGASARTRLAAAATALQAALGKGGGGITFEVVQTQTMVARPGGPKLEIQDPAVRGRVLGLTDTLPVGTLVERGVATPVGFWSEIVLGPEPGAEASFDLAAAAPAYQALVRDGVRWRAEGDGWYRSDTLPGIGIDPDAVLKLAGLLGDTADASDAALTAETDPAFTLRGLKGPAQPAARAMEATSKVANLPALIAPDLTSATELRGKSEFELDAAGRLVSLTVTARNTRMEQFDLVLRTVITFRYPDAAPPLPEPLPAYVAPAASDGE